MRFCKTSSSSHAPKHARARHFWASAGKGNLQHSDPGINREPRSDLGTERHKERKRRSKRTHMLKGRRSRKEGRSNKERGGIFVRGREKEGRWHPSRRNGYLEGGKA